MPNFVFDARVIQDHFPGIGRYALNLLRAFPAVLRADERITVLHDPAATNTRLPFDPSAWDARFQFVAYSEPVFGARNLVRPLPARGDLAHHLYYVRPVAGGRSVTTIYDAISFVYPQLLPSARARLLIHLFHSLAIRASRSIITISSAAGRDLERVFPVLRSRLTVTPLAADAVFTPQTDALQHALRARLNISGRFALYLASNKPHKNIARLIEAWARCERPSECMLLIAGHQDPRYATVEALAQQHGVSRQVRLLGPVSDADAAALYSACDVFVFPSLYEGFGLTPLEAMSCGAPVICSNVSSLPEVTGDAALQVSPDDTHALAAALTRVLADASLRVTLRERSLRRATLFSWQRTAADTIALYRDAAA
jgi:alpha-1,3-rhamnosyl/mannosyltransferase